jgi:hypothetical protein
VKTPPHRKPFYQKVRNSMDQMLALELNTIRTQLIGLALSPHVSLAEFFGSAIAYWQSVLQVDRIFISDMRSGRVLHGWQAGAHLLREEDWDEGHVPLENDETLQKALVSDELIINPVPGAGVDMAFTLKAGREMYLIAFDQTDSARQFSPLDLAQINLARDLMLFKAAHTTEGSG